VRGEDLVGAAAEEEGLGPGEDLVHEGAHGGVEVGDDPAAQAEAGGSVLRGAAGGLHDAVEGQEGGDGQLGHG
jgi:hypothetical protein